MKSLFFALCAVCFFAAASSSYAVLYQNDAMSLPVGKSASAPESGWNFACATIRASDGVLMGNFNIGIPPAISASSYTVNVPASNQAYQYYIVVYAAPSSLYSNVASGNGRLIRWISSYTGTGLSLNGPFVGGSPQDNSGNPANPATGESVAPRRYDQSVTVSNAGTSVAGYELSMVGESGNLLATKYVYLQPDSAKSFSFAFNEPFVIKVYQLRPDSNTKDPGGNAIDPLWNRASDTPSQTIAGAGSQNTPLTSDSPQISETASNNMATPSATAGSQQAQIQQGNDQITGAVKDGTAQALENGQKLTAINNNITTLKDAVNAGTAKQDTTNSKLGEIGNNIGTGNNTLTSISGKIEGTNTAISGLADKVNGLGTKLDKIADNTKGGDADNGASALAAEEAPDPDSTSWAGEVMGRVQGVKAAISNLAESLGLASNPGSAPLIFSIPMPIGSASLNLEDLGGSTLDSIRSFELFLISIAYVLTVSRIARSAFI